MNNAKIEANKRAYGERQKKFSHLKNGLIKKYVEDGLDLKERQQKSIFKITDTPQGDYSFSSGYFHACTAFGKTYLMMAIAEGFATENKDNKIIIFEENTNVLEQVKKDFIEKTSFTEDDIGAFYGSEKATDTPIVICTYASMEKLISEVGHENVGLVLCDEAHHGLSDRRKEFIRNTFNGACLYGFTGTPDYNAHKTCEDLFDTKIDAVDIREGVKSHLLCSVKNGLLVSRIPVDLTDCMSTTGDYDDEKLLAAIEKASHKKGIRESLAEYYMNGSDEDLGKIYGKTTMINVPNQKEADRLAEAFNQAAGKTIAKAYHTNSGDEPLQEFNEGKFPVLVQVNRLSEGYSNPKVEVCINYPTASMVRETQCSGRALRFDKNNPHKMALVLDIAFMKGDGSDFYEQIAQNGQVLFKDVAEDVCVIAPELQRIIQQREAKTPQEAQEKVSITDDMLFDIITDYEELFTLALEHEKHKDYILPHRNKLETDISRKSFITKWHLKQGTKIIWKENAKTCIWDELQKTVGQNILIRVLSHNRIAFVLPEENVLRFKQWLWDNKGIIILDNVRKKYDTDITWSQFRDNWRLEKDGKAVTNADRLVLWNNFQQTAGKNALACVKSGLQMLDVLPKENIAILEQWLKNVKGITVHNNIRDKLDTDLDRKQFISSWHLERNGKTVKDKAIIWDELLQSEGQKIFISVKAARKMPYVVPQENIQTFKNCLYEKKGIIIPERKEAVRDKSDTDISREQFVNTWRLEHNGKIIGQVKDKFAVWDELQNISEQNILVRVKFKNRLSFVLPKENISLLKQWLKENKSIDAFTPVDKLHEVQEKAVRAKNKKDRKKYLAQAKRFFELFNPEVKKQNICSTCLKKIGYKE